MVVAQVLVVGDRLVCVAGISIVCPIGKTSRRRWFEKIVRSVVPNPVDPSHLFELTAPLAGSKRIPGKDV